jgi:cell division transport system ATP-binding protein
LGNKLPALKDINIIIESGSKVIISGPTGAGKTTLLRLLYADLKPSSGEIMFKNQDLSTLKRKQKKLLKQISGIIFQYPKLISNITCFENIIIPLILNGVKRNDANQKCLEILSELDINYLRTKYPAELSIGEKKLVATARAVVHQPEIIIADEPTENLDENSKEKMISILRKSSERNSTLIMASNDNILKNSLPEAVVYNLVEGRISGR